MCKLNPLKAFDKNPVTLNFILISSYKISIDATKLNNSKKFKNRGFKA